MTSKRMRTLALAFATAVLVAACGSGGGYQRGIFTGYVVDVAEEDIMSKVGKPDRIDTADANAPKWIYKKKTFDPENMNKTDDETVVVMKKDPATGKWKGAEVMFL